MEVQVERVGNDDYTIHRITEKMAHIKLPLIPFFYLSKAALAELVVCGERSGINSLRLCRFREVDMRSLHSRWRNPLHKSFEARKLCFKSSTSPSAKASNGFVLISE